MPATTPIPTSEAATSDDLRFITITPQYNTSQKKQFHYRYIEGEAVLDYCNHQLTLKRVVVCFVVPRLLCRGVKNCKVNVGAVGIAAASGQKKRVAAKRLPFEEY
jgi:hypothetical protein